MMELNKISKNLFVFLLFALWTTVFAGHYQSHGHGHNDHYEEKYPYQPYGFGYDVEDGHGNKQWRHEKSHQPWHVTGSYGYKDKHGIMREVDYVADKHGFRAKVRTNEPGTAPKDPADVKMDAHPIQTGGHHYQSQHSGGYGHGGHGHDSGHYGSSSNNYYAKHEPHYAASNPAIRVIPFRSYY